MAVIVHPDLVRYLYRTSGGATIEVRTTEVDAAAAALAQSIDALLTIEHPEAEPDESAPYASSAGGPTRVDGGVRVWADLADAETYPELRIMERWIEAVVAALDEAGVEDATMTSPGLDEWLAEEAAAEPPSEPEPPVGAARARLDRLVEDLSDREHDGILRDAVRRLDERRREVDLADGELRRRTLNWVLAVLVPETLRAAGADAATVDAVGALPAIPTQGFGPARHPLVLTDALEDVLGRSLELDVARRAGSPTALALRFTRAAHERVRERDPMDDGLCGALGRLTGADGSAWTLQRALLSTQPPADDDDRASWVWWALLWHRTSETWREVAQEAEYGERVRPAHQAGLIPGYDGWRPADADAFAAAWNAMVGEAQDRADEPGWYERHLRPVLDADPEVGALRARLRERTPDALAAWDESVAAAIDQLAPGFLRETAWTGLASLAWQVVLEAERLVILKHHDRGRPPSYDDVKTRQRAATADFLDHLLDPALEP